MARVRLGSIALGPEGLLEPNAALASYGLSRELLQEVLPIGQALSTRTIRRPVQHVASRLDAELGEKGKVSSEGGRPSENQLAEPAGGRVVGLDGAYVHVKDQRSRIEGWFEVIVGKEPAYRGSSLEVRRLCQSLRRST